MLISAVPNKMETYSSTTHEEKDKKLKSWQSKQLEIHSNTVKYLTLKKIKFTFTMPYF